MANSPSSTSTQFFTSERALARHFRARAGRMRFEGASREDALAWQKKARRRLSKRLGLPHFARVAPRPRQLESVGVEGLTRELWLIETERDVTMPFILFVPARRQNEKLPAVICPHGHASGGKLATTGRRDVAGMDAVIETYNYDYGVQLARAGFITVCPDARGFGARREPSQQTDAPDAFLQSSCHNLTLAGAPLGLSVQGMWTWDLMRLLDFLTTDERVDGARIGCAGLSGGGLQTLNLAALDTRVKAAVVSGYFYGVRESLQVDNANCACNIVPGLWEDFDMGDIGALIAPRGLFIETGDADPLNGASGLENVAPQVRVCRKVFRALGAASQLQHDVFAGGHRWCGTQAIAWLQAQLRAIA